jgi:hypothetical protein
MTTGDPGNAPSEEELRAAYEAQLKQVRVEHVLLDNVVALINLGMRRTGLAPGTEDERDPVQVRLAIESVRALMPQLGAVAPREIEQIRSALSQLQMAYVRIGGAPAPASGPPPAGTPDAGAPGGASPRGGSRGAGTTPASEPAEPPPAGPGEPGPAQRSGRLWVPGS